jgi:hypothetical protein
MCGVLKYLQPTLWRGLGRTLFATIASADAKQQVHRRGPNKKESRRNHNSCTAYFDPTTSPVMSFGLVLEKLDTSPMMASMAALSWVAFWKSDMLPHSRVAWTQ